MVSVRSQRQNSQFEPGTSLVKGPYVAETIRVSVENDYVVVDL